MTPQCQRARSLVSVGLDGPLNDLEQHFVSAHLGRCGACLAFQEDAQAFTTLLRDAPLEPVPWPVNATAHARRSPVRFRTIAQVASVASVVIVAGTIALASEFRGIPSESSAVAQGGAAALVSGEDSIRSLRREALVRHDLPILPEGSTPSPGSASGGDASVSLLKPALPVDGA